MLSRNEDEEEEEEEEEDGEEDEDWGRPAVCCPGGPRSCACVPIRDPMALVPAGLAVAGTGSGTDTDDPPDEPEPWPEGAEEVEGERLCPIVGVFCGADAGERTPNAAA